MDLREPRKLNVGRLNSCNPMMRPSVTSDEMSHNPQAPGPVKKASTLLLKENPWRKLRPLSIDDLIGDYVKPEGCEETLDGCLACRINGFIRN